MPSIFDWSSTAGSNSSVDGVNVATGMPVQNTDNAIRSLMAAIRQTFSVNLRNFLAGSETLQISQGGTGAPTAVDARTTLGAAKSGANSDITSLSGLTTALAAAYGGTGQATPVFTLSGDATAGTLTMSVNGATVLKLTWKDYTVAANSSATVTYHGAFSSWSRAWCSGGRSDLTAQGNFPAVSAQSATNATVVNAYSGVSISGTVFAIGV